MKSKKTKPKHDKGKLRELGASDLRRVVGGDGDDVYNRGKRNSGNQARD